MPYLRSIGTAAPPHVLDQNDVKPFVRSMFGEAFEGDIDRLIAVFDNSRIERRHFCVPIEWFGESHTFQHKNDLYIAHGLELAEQAVDACLADADCAIEDIDYLMFISTTGLSTPSMDALLLQRLPFRRDVKRLPIWGLGCAGGAAGLSRGLDLALAHPDARVLVVVVELCGLTFQRNRLDKAALIATSLFADGAAAMLIEGDAVGSNPGNGPLKIVDAASSTLPDSLDVMGWEISGDGFGVLISRDIPSIVRTFMRESIDVFLASSGITTDCVRAYIAHPGGAKVLDAYREALGLHEDDLRHSTEVLRRYGNMSAASVLFVLEAFLDEGIAPGEIGLVGALGPGFSAELVLVQGRSSDTDPRRSA